MCWWQQVIISEKYAKEQLLPFIRFIENDEFWKAQIEQVHVEKNGDVILTPLVGDQIIELGKITGFSREIKKHEGFLYPGIGQQ